MIRPEGMITRAEVATIFFRLSSDELRTEAWSQTNPFGDVELRHWFNNAVSTTANMGVFMGVSETSFAPNRQITRGELATVLVRFMDQGSIGQFAAPFAAGDQFSDIDGHWAQAYINRAAAEGWVQGRHGLGGPFEPDAPISRAETAAMINRMFGRLVEGPSSLLPDMLAWPDNANPNAWYYLYMQMASNSYNYRPGVGTRYKELIRVIEARNWAVLERPDSRPEDILG